MTDARTFAPQTRALTHPLGGTTGPVVEEHGFADDFASVLEHSTVHRSTIGCVIPAYNEEESIAQVIEALLGQTRVPDVIHVVVNNTSDATVKIASEYSGPHEITTDLGEQFTEVFVHDIGKNPDKKVGALNYGYSLVEGYDYLLGVDGDTIADNKAVEYLETEAVSDSRIGGISAIYTIDDKPIKGMIARFLTAGQRTQFAAFNLQNLLRGRNMAVLGGQFSIFSTNALREAMKQNHQVTPWVKDSEVEDSLLSLQIKIRQLPNDTYGITLEFALNIAVEGAANSETSFTQQTVYQYLPIAIFESDASASAGQPASSGAGTARAPGWGQSGDQG